MKSGYVIQEWENKLYLFEVNEPTWVKEIKRAKEFATQEEAQIAVNSLPETCRANIIKPQIV
jgi:glutathione synthase/RimK-type ligase-like ATP-grasp enzyme